MSGTTCPAGAELAAGYLIHVLAWLFVFPLGYAMDFSQMRRYWSDLPELFVIKFLVTPALIFALGWLVGLRGDALYAVTVLAASPTAINAVIAARLHQINVHLAMAALISTTTAYILIVLPLILLLLN
ncbi:AEC family transporter [bacterium]|nr:AEC family transporter [bacterium]